ncbi:MAG: heavy-metal-associated domain-containing protein [Flavobacteriales bacterium]|nr:heavy-metal-associated domain-containing protein [Flavobacteriales bacterium]
MKTIFRTLLLAAILFVAPSIQAQDKIVETSFTVSGVCGMCEDRIEKAVDVKGVKYADYDLDTQTLSIIFNTQRITEEEIHQLLNEVGHDTERSMATDEQYNTVHACCKYRDQDEH